MFRIRIKQAIWEKIGSIMTRFIGKQVFFLPFQKIRWGLTQLLWTKYCTCSDLGVSCTEEPQYTFNHSGWTYDTNCFTEANDCTLDCKY